MSNVFVHPAMTAQQALTLAGATGHVLMWRGWRFMLVSRHIHRGPRTTHRERGRAQGS